MQKQILRIRDFGEHLFWHIMHDIAHSPENSQAQLPVPLHIWQMGEADVESSQLITILQKDAIPFELHSLASDESLESLQELGKKQQENALHITCGLTTSQQEVLGADATGYWVNGSSSTSALCAALAELALLREVQPEMDQLRFCWLGRINPLGHSLIEAGMYIPYEFFLALPPGGDPDQDITAMALRAGAKIFLTREPELALEDAQLIYVDASMYKAEAPEASAPLGLGAQNFSWRHGLYLSPELMSQANAPAPMLPTVPEASLPQTGQIQERRMALRRIALHILLRHMAEGLSLNS